MWCQTTQISPRAPLHGAATLVQEPMAVYTMSQKMSQVWLPITLIHIHHFYQFLAHAISRSSPMVHESSSGGEHRTRSLLRWEGIVENIGFEPGTKEWRSMDAWEWWWLQRWLDKWMRRWIEITLVMLMEWIWKLVPKTRWCTFCFCCLYKEYSYSQVSTVKRIKFTVWDRRFALREALKETPHGGKECNHPRNWVALDTLTK